MNNLITLGRFFFAIGMAVFGIQYIWYGPWEDCRPCLLGLREERWGPISSVRY